jgi:hypothetical protein
MPYTENMSTPEYMRYIQFQRHLLDRIRALLAEHNVADFESTPLEYEDLVRLHDDLHRLKHCPYALDHWRLMRNAT